jgi:hypothetical protein
MHGQLVIMAMLAYAGEVEAGERAVAPFRTLATPIVDMVKPMRYPEIHKLTEGAEEAARSVFLDTVDGGVAGEIVHHLQASSAQMAVAQIRVLGGAMARAGRGYRLRPPRAADNGSRWRSLRAPR